MKEEIWEQIEKELNDNKSTMVTIVDGGERCGMSSFGIDITRKIGEEMKNEKI